MLGLGFFSPARRQGAKALGWRSWGWSGGRQAREGVLGKSSPFLALVYSSKKMRNERVGPDLPGPASEASQLSSEDM